MKLVLSLLAAAVSVLALAVAAPASHERPGVGTPTSVALVPAFAQCVAPNTSHTAPLATFGGSCTPQAPRSSELRVGTVGSGAGRARYGVFCTNGAQPPCTAAAGDQEDIQISLTLTDVRCRGDLGPAFCAADGDYLREIVLSVPVRVTDHANGAPASNCANTAGDPPCTTATVEDFALQFVTGCTPTGNPTLGSACNLVTTADTVNPGMVIERQRAVYEAGSIVVLDLGPDGGLGAGCPPVCGTGDERPFMAQGWFAP